MLSFIKTTFGELMKRRNCAKRSANRQIERAKDMFLGAGNDRQICACR
jgi:hypothetical protein